MPRKKVVRTVEEEEEFRRVTREKKAKWMAKKRETKKMITKENCQSLLMQPSTSFSKNIIIDSHDSINSMKIVYPTNETISTTSQTINLPIIKNASIIKNSNEVTVINKNMRFYNVSGDIEITQNIRCTTMETSSNNNIIYSLSGSSNNLINFNDNSNNNIISPAELLSQNDVISDKIPNKSKLTVASRNKKTRLLRKGYIDINTSDITQLQNITEHYIGEMNIFCEHCSAKHFKSEKVANKGNSFNDCCNHGSVRLNSLPQPPDELYELFVGTHSKSDHFFNRIRVYNNTFSFASFNANISNFSTQRRGPYCFKIQGQIYYQINTALYPAPNNMPSYGQLFIVDNNEATEYRLHRNSNLDEHILRSIDNIMRTNNIFAQSYRMMHEEIQTQMTENHNIPELQLGFLTKKGIDRGRYNIQRVNEVAAVFSTTANGEIPETYVTIYNKNNRTLQQVSTMDPNVEPWIYPLYYPYGNQGWCNNLRRIDNNKQISRTAYVKYRIAIRDDFNIFLMGRRLFQQWLVDSYVKIEKDRINFCKQNQKQLRAETYQGLIDYLANAANNNDAHIGKMIILPSTFVGSPRNMLQHYQDAMAIVRKYGKPDIFITMTCNPNWREIKENLLPNQQPSDRPDICARVFNIKKDYLIDVIVRQKFFGEVLAYVYVIEFQKRGLPHIHLLITLKQNYKILNSETVDKFISAEIPDPNENENLHSIVMKHMIHGPCGDWCLINDKCSKHFPKSFQSETIMDEDGYPQYRRRNNGLLYERPGRYVVDNRYVVPYNPKLLLLFNSHINVEIVSSIRSVKYLYKYIYKGHDAASMIIGENINKMIIYDEIRDFIEARYVGPVEACWRILSKTLQEKSHAIIRLPVHLPNEHSIIIDENINNDAIRSAVERVTMLLDYFKLNARDEEAKQYLYSEIPSHYVFKKITINGKIISRWEKRQRYMNCIGRMYSVSPSQIELFNLRILLLHVRGATSFEELKTVNNEIHHTFTAACLALGLIEDDEEWNRAMNEAKIWMMPRRLRNLFVRILIHCQPVHPKQLWDDFKRDMSEDYIRQYGFIIGIKKTYDYIINLLLMEGSNITNFPEMEQLTMEQETNIEEQIQEDISIGIRQYEQLNVEQKEIVDTILAAAITNTNSDTCFYIDGPGGSGKTFIYTTLYYLLKSKSKIVNTMAFTGIAATLLPNGKTIHKIFGLPVPLFADS